MGEPVKALRPLLAASLVLSLLAGASDAAALGPIDLEAGLRAGVATNPSDGVNPYGLGVGARAGVGLFDFYAGLSVMRYFGSSDTLPLAGEVSTSTTLFGGEIGYTITALPLVRIRPQLGIGNASFSSEAGNVESSTSHLYLEPGALVFVPIGLFYVGADANALIVPDVQQGTGSETFTALTIHGQLGVRF